MSASTRMDSEKRSWSGRERVIAGALKLSPVEDVIPESQLLA